MVAADARYPGGRELLTDTHTPEGHWEVAAHIPMCHTQALAGLPAAVPGRVEGVSQVYSVGDLELPGTAPGRVGGVARYTPMGDPDGVLAAA